MRENPGSEASTVVEDLRRAIVRTLEEHADPRIAALDRRFEKSDDFVSYGLKASDFHRITRGFRAPLKRLSLSDRLVLAEKLLTSGISEQAGIAVRLLALSTDDLSPAEFGALDRFVDHFRGWSTTDSFCIYVLQPLLRRCETEVMQLLRSWNVSTNRWKRRASVAAFVRKVGESGEYTDEVLELCEALIWDEDDLVRKGVGWALKDNMRGAKDRVIEYVKSLRRRGVSSTITLYAMRDLKGEERRSLLAIRPGAAGQKSQEGRQA
jgi:3-methyladenine DNA glycosylase AlkD